MARPCKSANLLTDYSQTKAEISARKNMEAKLKGNKKTPPPPGWLTDNQKKIYRAIVEGLKEADVLCSLDVWVLQECAVAIDNLERIGRDINSNPELLYDRSVLAARENNERTFFRCCNELSLSPQSRAKISNIKSQAADTDTAILQAIISGDYS